MRTPVKTSSNDATPSFRKKVVKNFQGFLKLFTKVQFMIAQVSNILLMFPINLVLVHAVNRMTSLGFDIQTGSLLLSCYGGATLLARYVLLS